MKRIHLLIAAGAAVLVATAALTPGGAAAASSNHRRFSVVVRDAEAAVSPADFFSTPPLQNAQGSSDGPVYRGSEKVGLAETVFTVTRVAHGDVVLMIECSVELAEGSLVFNGTAHLADVGRGASVPVVGGTGAYAGSRGTVTMVGSADGSSTALHFDLSDK